MVIIWANLVVLEHLMTHTKIQSHQPFGSGEEDFFRFLPYMGMAAILVMWPGPFEQTFVHLSHRCSIWNLTLIGPVVSEEKMFKECGRRRTTIELPKVTIIIFIQKFEPPNDKTNKMTCAPSEDSDQPGHPPSLIRVFAVIMKKPWTLSYPLSTLWRLWSDWVGWLIWGFRWVQRSFCWFCREAAHFIKHCKRYDIT